LPGGKRAHNTATIYYYLYLAFSFSVRVFLQYFFVSSFSSAWPWYCT